MDQYYKVTSEFERLGDHGVNIAEHAAALHRNNTVLSAAALAEVGVVEKAILQILDEAQQTFQKRDVEAAKRIEPLVQVIADLNTMLKRNHLKRMATGECNVYADSTYTDLLIEFRRIGDVCSNVGIATMVRVYPELADHEHKYFDRLHAGGNEDFDAAYNRVHDQFFSMLKLAPAQEPEKLKTAESEA
jgi:phosphate:Na+ symporter